MLGEQNKIHLENNVFSYLFEVWLVLVKVRIMNEAG